MNHAKSAILFVGHDATRTGAPASLLNIVKWFATNTDRPLIVVLGNGGPLVAQYAKFALVHIWANQPKPQHALSRLRDALLGRAHRHEKVLLDRHHDSIIQSLRRHRIGCIFNNTGVNGHILAKLEPELSAPVISRIPELEAYMRKNNVNGSVNRVLAISEHFVAASQAVKENLVARYAVAAERVSVIHGACDTQRVSRGTARLREKLGIPETAFVVGGCGTLDYRKGIDLFIQIANRATSDPNGSRPYFCWIGGRVSENSYIDLSCEVENLGLTGKLFFLGEVADPAPYLADLDLFLLTSREDPFPLVMLEAARQSLPILCFDGAGGASEFVDETIGARVPMLDVPAMAQLVEHYGQMPELRSRLGAAAYDRSLAYTADRMGSLICEVVMRVMEDRHVESKQVAPQPLQ